MAFTMTSRSGRTRYRPLSEINVTPLVDVMLVLLIIFMVTAPLMTTGVSVDLPKANATALNNDSEPLTVSINANGKIYLQDQQAELPELVTRLQALAKDNPERRIFVRGDKDLAYGRIMEVMGTITQGGFTKVALLAEQSGLAPAPGARPVGSPGGGASSAPASGSPASGPAAAPATPSGAPAARPAPSGRKAG
jgi:biopolymer transport protein TolR